MKKFLFLFLLFNPLSTFNYQLSPIPSKITNSQVFYNSVEKSFRKHQIFFVLVHTIKDMCFLILTKKASGLLSFTDKIFDQSTTDPVKKKDKILNEQAVDQLTKEILKVGVFFVVYYLVNILIDHHNEIMEINIQQRTHNTVLNHLIHQHHGHYNQLNSAQLSDNISEIANRIKFIITRKIMIMSNIIPLLYVGYEVFQFSLWILVGFAIITSFNYWVNNHFRKKFQSILPEVLRNGENITNIDKSILDNFLLIHLNHNQTSVMKWLIKNQKKHQIVTNKAETFFLKINALMEISFTVFNLGGLIIILKKQGNLTNLANFHNFSGKFVGRFNGLIGRIFAIAQVQDKYKNAFKNLQLKPWNTVPFRNLQFTGHIKIINGLQKYKDNTVFQGSFSSENFNHHYVSIVGPSGAGKTTFLKILGHVIDPSEGKVMVETTDAQGKIQWYAMNQLHPKDIANNILFITQEPYFFHQSLKDNLEMGGKVANYDDILESLNLKTIIEQKGGINFILENNGSNLSGGQRQRIAIARALVQHRIKKYKIILLDEYNSALDEESKKIINRVVRDTFNNTLVMAITHDPQTIESQDKIMTFKNGTYEEK